MLPQRPAGAPPRPSAKPPGTPPPARPGKPPGPPPGPPPGTPGSAAPAKPPPRGPPPSTASTAVVPAQPPPSAPPARAEAKVSAPPPVVEAQTTAPPSPQLAPAAVPAGVQPLPRVSPEKSPEFPPHTDTDGKPSTPSRAPPPGPPPGPPPSFARAPQGVPPGSLPGAKPGTPSTPGRPPRGTPPARPPPGAPPGAPIGLCSSATPTARAHSPTGAPPGAPLGSAPRAPPRGPPPGVPPGTCQGVPLPRGQPRGPPPASLPDAAPTQKEQPTTPSSTGSIRPGVESASPRGLRPDAPPGTPPGAPVPSRGPQADARQTRTDGGKGEDEQSGGEQASGQDVASRVVPSAKAPKSPPPSPKALPGIPAGIVPPKSAPRAQKVALVSRANADQHPAKDKSNPASTEKLEDQHQLVAAKKSPPGDPGRRRPPPGAPPGRPPPQTSVPSTRPTPPPGEELAKLNELESVQKAKRENEVWQTGAKSEEREPPPPPAGLPPLEGLSDDEDDNEEEEGGQMVVTGGNGDLAWGDKRAEELGVVRRGRFTVRCIAGADVRKSTLSDKIATVDAYLKLTLGKHKRAPTKKSKVVKKSGMNPSFDFELLSFDIVEPQEFIVGGDVTLSVELWDDSAWADDLLASVELSALRFMDPDAVPTAEWLPLEATSGRVKDRMKVQVEIRFEPALLGMFVLTLFEGKGLGANDPAARPNPYVVATLGEMYQKRSRVVSGGGGTPFFKEEEILLWIDKENWTNNLRLQVRSEDIGTDGELGEATISVLHAMAAPPDKAMEQRLDLTLEGQPSGHLFVKTAFLPAGKLTLVCESARQLRLTSAAGRMDPYVVFTAEGQVLSERSMSGSPGWDVVMLLTDNAVGHSLGMANRNLIPQAVFVSRKTKVDKDGGSDPRWGETVEFDIVDQYLLSVECFNHDLLESDEPIGTAQCSLLPAFKRGTMDIWIQLTTSAGPGPPKAAGEVHCTFTFSGPMGVAFPQHQPGSDSFDDSLRINIKGYLEEADQVQRRVQGEGDGGDASATVSCQERGAFQRSNEFTDAEIAAAFKFLDLDGNQHIGAAEIRHILICMGELITDEEVDMMISMVDMDGDGQVSFEEFHRLVIDPDPSRPDFTTESPQNDPKEAAVVSQEMKDRESKRWLLGEFVKENEIRSVELEMAYKRFINLAPSSGGAQATQSFELDFNTWVSVFNVEATGQYRKLFKLYGVTGTGGVDTLQVDTERADIREFCLGVANFVEWSLEQRAQFVFTLYDNNRSGFLSMNELVAVLKANHLSSAKAVGKKAQTIMRQADADGSGTLTLDEFIVVAKKFPNLLFPAQRKTEPGGNGVPLLGNG